MELNMTPITKTYTLKSDPSIQVVINQAREGENLERQDMFSRVTREYNDPILGAMGGNLRLVVDQNPRRLARKEVYLTLNRVIGITMKGRDVFKSETVGDFTAVRFGMTEDEFNRAWGMLPENVAAEIHECVYDLNWFWDPERQGESAPGSSTSGQKPSPTSSSES